MTNDRPTDGMDLLEQATDALRDQPVPAGPDFAVRDRLLSALHADNSTSPSPLHQHPRRSVMIRTLSLAASILVFAAVIGWLVPSGNPLGGSAFAQMLKEVARVRSVVITSHAEFGNAQSIDGTIYILEPDRMREEQGEGEQRQIVIVDMQRKQMLGLHPAKMTATRSTFEVQAFGKSTSLLQSFRELSEDSAKFLGREMMDGRETLEYHGRHPTGYYWLWIAANDHLPVKMVVADTSDIDKAQFTQTLSNIRWDVPLDESLFSLEIPAGYQDVTQPSANVPQ